MNRQIAVLIALCAGACFIEPAAAQMSNTAAAGPAVGSSSASTDYSRNATIDLISKDLLKQKRDKLGLTAPQLQEKDKADLTAVLNSVQFSCQLTNAQLQLEGTETVDGASVKTQSYEAACSNGLGYFIIGRGQQSRPSGITCFAADATRQADLKANRPPDLACTLPENLDVKAMAANVVLRKGLSCTVRDVRWVGVSAKSNTDYTEIACGDGTGFILASPLPGSTATPQLVKCHDAAAQGIPCKLSDNGAMIVTLQTFKDALAQHQVACDATDVRVIGKETTKQRHVVEFACPQHPAGLVAFIPLEGNTAPFETVDCAAAAKRGLACKLTPGK